MPVKQGLPTWLENGGALIAPAIKPRSLQLAPTFEPEPPLEPPEKSLAKLKLPGEGETMAPEVAVQLLVLGEYEILQAYLDRLLSERFPPLDQEQPNSSVPED